MTALANNRGRWARAICAAALAPTAACRRAPTFDILGSFFPAWLVCIFLGVALTACCSGLFARLRVVVVYPMLVYPSLIAGFTFSLWLVFFR